jgi:ATP/maltotriose-dependent transcriptional regulator MalT
LERSLALPHGPDKDAVWAKAASGVGILSNYQGQYSRAKSFLNRSLEIFRQGSETRGMAVALCGLAQSHAVEGDYARAEVLCAEAEALTRGSRDEWGLANSLWYYGNTYWMEGNNAAARHCFEESLAIHDRLGNAYGSSYVRVNLAFVDMDDGRLDRAERALKEAALETRLDRRIVTRALYGLGQVHLASGDLDSALNDFQRCLQLLHELGDRFYVANLLEAIAGTAVQRSEFEPASRLFGAAEELRAAIHAPRMPRTQPDYEQQVAASRTALGPELFSRLWAAGRALPQDQAVRLALALPETRVTPQDPRRAAGLTPREIEVLRLLAEGLTNDQIAGRLFISARTVHTHLNSIFRKLGVSTRSAATRVALQSRLI